MKILLLAFWGLLMLNTVSKAQFTSGDYFHIATQTPVIIDGLVFKPSVENFVLDNKVILCELTAVPGNGGSSILRIYKFNEPVMFTGVVGIAYRSEELNNNNENELKLIYESTLGIYQTKLNSLVNINKHFVSADFNDECLLKLTAVDGSVALPVKLIEFFAKKAEASVTLEWNTAEEISSDHFEIQWSQDGKQWLTLGKVNAKGESNSLQHYAFKDFTPASGNNLYRLKMVDSDGTSAFSKIAMLKFSETTLIYVYPNPASHWLYIKTSKNEVVDHVKISNLVGQVVCRSREADIQLDALPAGTYFVEVKLKSGAVGTSKIVRN